MTKLIESRITHAAQQVVAQQPIQSIDQGKWLIRRLQVVASARYDVPNTAARVRHITAVTRDDMDMQMSDSLPGGRARVEADVVPVWPQLGVELTLHLVHEG
jgi:hypothetical protein